MQPLSDLTKEEYGKIVHAVRKDLYGDTREKFAERIKNNFHGSEEEIRITHNMVRSWEIGNVYPELRIRSLINKWWDEIPDDLKEIDRYLSKEPKIGPPFILNFFGEHISERELEQKLQKYRGEYLCYYDLWGRSETTHKPYLSLRRYTIDSIVHADGSLVGTFLSSRKAAGSSLHGSRSGSLKFVMTPDHRDLFYVVEHDPSRALPPVTGIVRAHDAHGLPYFYGMLLRFRGEADGPIAAVKCLILRHKFADDDDFTDEVAEDNIGDPEKWKSLKYIFCGIHEHDSPGRLQSSPEFKVILEDNEIIDVKINKNVENIYEREMLSKKYQNDSELFNEDKTRLRPIDKEYMDMIGKLYRKGGN